MSVIMTTFDTRNEWLNARLIGGSGASCIVGLNPWKSNVEYWQEMVGITEPEDISDKDVVVYGTKAEASLRQMFRLDYPQYRVDYRRNNLWRNDKYPFATASLDGWITDKDGRKGILEIKTTNVMSSRQKEKWNDRIPDNYYCQLMWYMGVTEFQFAKLKAQLRWEINGEVYCQTRHYHIERADVEDDIRYLFQAAERFWNENVIKKQRPALILPEF